MTSLEMVLEAPNSAEATAQYWVWRASRAGGPEERAILRAKMFQRSSGARGVVNSGNAEQELLANRMERQYGGPSAEAGRAAIYLALREDLAQGLQEEPQRRDGVQYLTDYPPIGRMATVLSGISTAGLPIKTISSTHREFAFVEEQGEPLTVIHGDIAVVQQHLVEAHGSIPPEILSLSAWAA